MTNGDHARRFHAGASIPELAKAGVRRISVGHALAGAAYGAVRAATGQLLAGEDRALREGIAHSAVQRLMTGAAGAGSPTSGR